MADVSALRQFIDQGELSHAESLVRAALERDSKQAELWEVLGQIAVALGDPQVAQRCFDRCQALGGRPQAVDHTPAETAAAENRFLLIKSWGFGFWADVACTVGHLCLAEMTARTPVVHWGTNCLYRDSRTDEAFGQFFLPVSDVALADLDDPSFDYYPPKWRSDNLGRDNLQKRQGAWSRMGGIMFLHRPEAVCVTDYYTGMVNLMPWIGTDSALYGRDIDALYRYFFDRYLLPLPVHQAQADRFLHDAMGSNPFVAIHLRGTDKVIENRENEALNRESIQRLEGLLTGFSGDTKVFLMTDDSRILQAMTDRFGGRLVVTDCERRGDERGVHQPSTRAEKSGYQLGVEILQDVLIASRASAFVGNATSNASLAVKFMGAIPDDACQLLGRNWFHTRFTHIYKP